MKIPYLDQQIILLLIITIGILLLTGLIQLLKRMFKKQINEKIEQLIPMKILRNRIAVKIKWR